MGHENAVDMIATNSPLLREHAYILSQYGKLVSKLSKSIEFNKGRSSRNQECVDMIHQVCSEFTQSSSKLAYRTQELRTSVVAKAEALKAAIAATTSTKALHVDLAYCTTTFVAAEQSFKSVLKNDLPQAFTAIKKHDDRVESYEALGKKLDEISRYMSSDYRFAPSGPGSCSRFGMSDNIRFDLPCDRTPAQTEYTPMTPSRQMMGLVTSSHCGMSGSRDHCSNHLDDYNKFGIGQHEPYHGSQDYKTCNMAGSLNNFENEDAADGKGMEASNNYPTIQEKHVGGGVHEPSTPQVHSNERVKPQGANQFISRPRDRPSMEADGHCTIPVSQTFQRSDSGQRIPNTAGGLSGVFVDSKDCNAVASNCPLPPPPPPATNPNSQRPGGQRETEVSHAHVGGMSNDANAFAFGEQPPSGQERGYEKCNQVDNQHLNFQDHQQLPAGYPDSGVPSNNAYAQNNGWNHNWNYGNSNDWQSRYYHDTSNPNYDQFGYNAQYEPDQKYAQPYQTS